MSGKPFPNIALYGRSGAGKSTVSEYLVKVHGYHLIHPGRICREITKRLFGSEDKTILNRVNDALRAIDPNLWVRVSLEEAGAGDALIIDGLRFKSNLEFLKDASFRVWKIESTEINRRVRLEGRGQAFDWQVDVDHAGEGEIENERFDYVFKNDGSRGQLYRAIEQGIGVAGL